MYSQPARVELVPGYVVYLTQQQLDEALDCSATKLVRNLIRVFSVVNYLLHQVYWEKETILLLTKTLSLPAFVSLDTISIDMNGRVCGALVQFGCYQHKHK